MRGHELRSTKKEEYVSQKIGSVKRSRVQKPPAFVNVESVAASSGRVEKISRVATRVVQTFFEREGNASGTLRTNSETRPNASRMRPIKKESLCAVHVGTL